MHTRELHTSNGQHAENGHLNPTITTGSTPPDFLPPPDKPEYHPYRLPISDESTSGKDWQDELELDTATMLAAQQASPLRFLVLYGSLRQTSYSRLLAFEMARLLEVGGVRFKRLAVTSRLTWNVYMVSIFCTDTTTENGCRCQSIRSLLAARQA